MKDLELIENFKKQIHELEEVYEYMFYFKDCNVRTSSQQFFNFIYALGDTSRKLFESQNKQKECIDSLSGALSKYLENFKQNNYTLDRENLNKKINSDKLVLMSMVLSYIDENVLDLTNKIAQIENNIQLGKDDKFVKKHLCKIINRYQQLALFGNQNQDVLQEFNYLHNVKNNYKTLSDLLKIYIENYKIQPEDLKEVDVIQEKEIFSGEVKEKIENEIKTNQLLIEKFKSAEYQEGGLYNIDIVEKMKSFKYTLDWHLNIQGVGPRATDEYHNSLKELLDIGNDITERCKNVPAFKIEQLDINKENSNNLFVDILEASAKNKLKLLEENTSSYNLDFYNVDKHVELKKSLADTEFKKLSIINSTCDIDVNLFDSYTKIKSGIDILSKNLINVNENTD